MFGDRTTYYPMQTLKVDITIAKHALAMSSTVLEKQVWYIFPPVTAKSTTRWLVVVEKSDALLEHATNIFSVTFARKIATTTDELKINNKHTTLRSMRFRRLVSFSSIATF